MAYGGGMVSATDLTIVIRPSRPEDDRALARLAGLDSARVPAEPLLVAEAGGELRAALSLRDRRAIADPFHFTRPLVALLTARAEQLLDDGSRRRRWRVRGRSKACVSGVSAVGRAC